MSTVEGSLPPIPLEEICCGDASAMEFCATFFKWAHWIDDILDNDQSYSAEHVIRLNLEAAVVFSNNEFFQKNRVLISPLVLQAARAFADSVEWQKKESVQDRRAADILKSAYHEIFWHIAYLTAVSQGKDGWKHMTAITAKYRNFDYDCKE